jgi:hypothetical protein
MVYERSRISAIGFGMCLKIAENRVINQRREILRKSRNQLICPENKINLLRIKRAEPPFEFFNGGDHAFSER